MLCWSMLRKKTIFAGRHRRSISPNRSATSSPSTPVANSGNGNDQIEKLFVHGHCQWPGKKN